MWFTTTPSSPSWTGRLGFVETGRVKFVDEFVRGLPSLGPVAATPSRGRVTGRAWTWACVPGSITADLPVGMSIQPFFLTVAPDPHAHETTRRLSGG
jgi:hypothetical protein